MAQNEPNWTQIVLASPIIQTGIAIGAIGAGLYFAYGTVKKLFSNGNGQNKDAIEKLSKAYDAQVKVSESQAKLIELLQQQIENSLDITEVKKSKTQPIPDMSDESENG